MELHRSVAEYFHQAVTDALRATSVTASPPTEFYLVNLLVEFTKEPHVGDEPLGLKMAQASQAAPEARARTLKDVGDTSLYVSGFFGESLTRKLVDVSYYIGVGETAYGQLASLSTRVASAASDFYKEVYDELAEKFAQFVAVLEAVRRSSNIASSTNVLKLVEEWARSGEDWIEERLKATGVLAAESFGPKIIH